MHNKYIYHRYVQCTLCTIDTCTYYHWYQNHSCIIPVYLIDTHIKDTKIINMYTTNTFVIDMCTIIAYMCQAECIIDSCIADIYIVKLIYVWCSFCNTLPASCKMFFFLHFFFFHFLFFWSIFFSFCRHIFSFAILSFWHRIHTWTTMSPQPSRVGRLSFEIPRC